MFYFDGIKAYDSNAIAYETDYKTDGTLTVSGSEVTFVRLYNAETDGETLQSVRVFTASANLKIEIDYIVNFTSVNNYSFSAKSTKSAAYPGWYTIDFPDGITLGSAGSTFAVVVKLTKTGSEDIVIGSYYGNPISDNQLYYYDVIDAKWYYTTINASLKAVTTPASGNEAEAGVKKVANDLTWDTIKGENTEQTEVRKALTLPTSFRGAAVTWTSANTAINAQTGAVTRRIGDTNDTGDLTATITKGSATVTKTFELTVIAIPQTDKDAVDAVNITWDMIRGSTTDTESNVTADLNLDVSLDEGFTVTWKSSIPAVINATDIMDDDEKEVITPAGKVTQPRFDKKNEVTLTAAVKKGEAEKTFTFELTVPNLEKTTKDIFEATFEWLRADLYENFWPLIKGDNEVPSQIRTNLTAPTKIEFTTEKGEPLSVEVYECRPVNTAKEDWDCVNSSGAVTRPDYGQENSAGYFRIWIDSDDDNHIGTYTLLKLTVLAYQGKLNGVTVDNVQIEAGQTAVLTAVVNAESNPGEVRYQWYSSATATNTGGTEVADATTAELSLADLAAGTYYYYCVVSALDAAETVTSNVAAVTVEAPDLTSTTTRLTASTTNAIYGDGTAITLTATVTGGTTVESGTVQFKDNGTNLGSAVDVVNGTAIVTLNQQGNYLTAGPHSFTAEYISDNETEHKNSSSSAVTVTIEKAAPSIADVSVSGTIYTSTIPSTIEFTYTGTPGTIKFADSVTKFTAGTGTYEWVFTPEDEVNYTTAAGTIEITAAAAPISSIAVTTNPTKMIYVYGEEFDPAGMVITVTYEDQNTTTIEAPYTGVTFSALGDAGDDKTVTVTYEGHEAAITGITVEPAALAGGDHDLSVNYDNTQPQTVSKSDFGITEDGSFELRQGAAITNSDRLKDGTPTISGSSISFELAAGDAAPTEPAAIVIPLTFIPSNGNYKAIDVTLTINVTAKTSVTLTASAYTRTYNGSTVTLEELMGSLSSGGVSGTWAFAEDADLPRNASADPYTVGLTFTPSDTAEYSGGETKISITINPAVITVKADSKSVTKNGAMPTLTYTVSGLFEGDTWVTEPEISCSAADTAAVGSFPITVSGGDAGGNYTITYVNGTLTISAPAAPPTPPTGGSTGRPSTTPPVQTGETTQGGTTITQTTATPTAATSGGKATAVVDAAAANAIVKQATENGSERVVIAPVITGNVTMAEVSIPAVAIGEIGRSTNASLTISTPMADVTIPNSGLSSLSDNGGSVTVTAEKNGSTVEVTVTANDRTVSSVPGGVTLSVPMEQTAPGTVAVLVREDGTREVVRKSMADADGIFIPLNGSAKVEIIDNSKTFTDVAPDNWAADAVAFVSAHELFSGTSDSIFSPNLSMTRSMMAVVLHNFESNPDTAFNTSFADVSGSAWYAEGVSWAANCGIIAGYGNGSFGAADPITREQLVVMLWRYFGSPAAANKELNFTDAGEISVWAREAVCWAAENGLVGGYVDGTFNPNGLANRLQAAKLLQNFLSRWTDTSY